MIVTVLGPVGSREVQVALDGAPTPFAVRRERGKPAWSASVAIGQGDSPVIDFRFLEPSAEGRKPILHTQSMANDPVLRVVTACGATSR